MREHHAARAAPRPADAAPLSRRSPGRALKAFRTARAVLVEELGIEPGRSLRQLPDRGDPGPRIRASICPWNRPWTARPRDVRRPRARAGRAGPRPRRRVRRPREPVPPRRRARRGQESGLAEELIARALDGGARALVGRCWEAGGAPAYWPWVQSLRPYLRDADTEVLRSELREGAVDVARLHPELRERLGDLAPAPAIESEGARFRLFDSLTAFIKRMATGRPLVVVLDDLHAADEPSLLLLRFVARELGDSRLVIVGAYRDVDPTLAVPARKHRHRAWRASRSPAGLRFPGSPRATSCASSRWPRPRLRQPSWVCRCTPRRRATRCSWARSCGCSPRSSACASRVQDRSRFRRA